MLVSLLWLGVTAPVSAQRIQSGHFEPYVVSRSVEAVRPGFAGNGRETGARASRGRSALTGALIGAAVGVLGGALAYSFCDNHDSGAKGSCIGKAGLVFGLNTGAGAFIGFLLGGD